MRLSLISACCVLLLVALGSALPVAQPSEALVVELAPAQETLHTLNLGEPNSDASGRDKRTIGVLREYFPTLSEIIDRQLQAITRFLFRVIGRLVLGGGGGGDTSDSGTGTSSTGGASASSSSGGGTGRRISITLPTYPPSLDDEDEEDEEDEDSSPASSTNDVLAAASDNKAETVAAPADRPEVKSRVVRATADQETAASDTAPAVDQDASAAEENRDKRFLFGFGGGDGGAGSAGGSGNFLFDIIRGAADSTGRAAGHLYRLVAGTSQDGLLLARQQSASRVDKADDDDGAVMNITQSTATPSLIAGSGTTEEAADAGHGTTATGTGGTGGAVGYAAGAAAIETPELDGKPDDGYTSGIPGPITRLFVIANRGVSNLIQDLILRLAQTSERIVNFKARLITSII